MSILSTLNGVGLGFSQDIYMDAIHDVFCKLALNESRVEKLISEGREKFYLFCSLNNRLIDISRREGRTEKLKSKTSVFGFEILIEESITDEEERKNLKTKVEELMLEFTPSFTEPGICR